MPFTNPEQKKQPNTKLVNVILIISMGLFATSLFNACFCTERTCRVGLEAFLIGWLAMLTDSASITWLANPFLIATWILLARNYRFAWIFGLAASLISLSFLKWSTVIENEAGTNGNIIAIRAGYWLWLASCITAFTGCLLLRVKQN